MKRIRQPAVQATLQVGQTIGIAILEMGITILVTNIKVPGQITVIQPSTLIMRLIMIRIAIIMRTTQALTTVGIITAVIKTVAIKTRTIAIYVTIIQTIIITTVTTRRGHLGPQLQTQARLTIGPAVTVAMRIQIMPIEILEAVDLAVV